MAWLLSFVEITFMLLFVMVMCFCVYGQRHCPTEQEPGGGDDVLRADQDEELEEAHDGSEEEDQDNSEEELDKEEEAAERMDGVEAANGGPLVDGDEEDMDDEAMFRLDDKLAAYFNAMQRGGAGKQMASALLSLRLRVVVLLEEYAKRSAHSPLLPSMLPTLLEALRRALRNPAHEQVGSRVSVCLCVVGN